MPIACVRSNIFILHVTITARLVSAACLDGSCPSSLDSSVGRRASLLQQNVIRSALTSSDQPLNATWSGGDTQADYLAQLHQNAADAEEEARLHAETAEQELKAGEEARLKAEEARLLAEKENEKLKAEEELKSHAAKEQASFDEYAELQQKADDVARLKEDLEDQKEEAKKKLEQMLTKAEEGTGEELKVHQEAKLKSEEEEKAKAEEEEKLKAEEEEAKLKSDIEAKLKAEKWEQYLDNEDIQALEEFKEEKMKMRAEEEAKLKAQKWEEFLDNEDIKSLENFNAEREEKEQLKADEEAKSKAKKWADFLDKEDLKALEAFRAERAKKWEDYLDKEDIKVAEAFRAERAEEMVNAEKKTKSKAKKWENYLDEEDLKALEAFRAEKAKEKEKLKAEMEAKLKAKNWGEYLDEQDLKTAEEARLRANARLALKLKAAKETEDPELQEEENHVEAGAPELPEEENHVEAEIAGADHLYEKAQLDAMKEDDEEAQLNVKKAESLREAEEVARELAEENARRDEEIAKRDEEIAKRDKKKAKRDAKRAKKDEKNAKKHLEVAKTDEENAKKDEEVSMSEEDAQRIEEVANSDEEVAKSDQENVEKNKENDEEVAVNDEDSAETEVAADAADSAAATDAADVKAGSVAAAVTAHAVAAEEAADVVAARRAALAMITPAQQDRDDSYLNSALIDRAHNVIMGWSPRAACTAAVNMFFTSAGMYATEEQLRFPWVHDYREALGDWVKPRLSDMSNEKVLKFKIVRNPYIRAISNWVEQVGTNFSYNPEVQALAAQHGVSVSSSFLQWLQFINEVGWQKLDHDSHPQFSQWERNGGRYDMILQLEQDEFESSLEQINKAYNVTLRWMPVTASLVQARKKFAQDWNNSAQAFSSDLYKQQAGAGHPQAEKLYTTYPEAVDLVQLVYGDDFNAYGYSRDVKEAFESHY